MTLTVFDEFAGWGGSSQGVDAIPGVEVKLAANHNELAVEVHGMNFPDTEHTCGDVAKLDLTKYPRADLFWSSPSCPPWADARGVRRDFDRSTQGVLFDPDRGAVAADEHVLRSRALVEEIPRYLRAMNQRGEPVLAGCVENVVQMRLWDQFGRWRREIEAEGYRTRVVALNAMHVQHTDLPRVAQSRDRFFLAYWLDSLGRAPDWDKWLRPTAYCPTCDRDVDAVQVFKKSGVDMGRYGAHGQYHYRCPNVACRNRIVEPAVLPAATIIDWSLDPGARIAERVDGKGRPDPLEAATVARIEAYLKRQATAMLAPAGGTWRDKPSPLSEPLPTRTTRETDALVIPPALVPLAARAGVDRARPVDGPMHTQTCRAETSLVMPPFISLLRGGGSRTAGYGVGEHPLTTVSAQGNHHALVGPPAALLSYYSNGKARPVSEPVGTLTTKDRYALVTANRSVEPPAVGDCTFRMLDTTEIGAGMGFARDYKVKGSKRLRVRGYGNAVPPPMSNVIFRALVECITGEDAERPVAPPPVPLGSTEVAA